MARKPTKKVSTKTKHSQQANRSLLTINIGIIVLTFVIAFALYPSFPEQVASHWNAYGQVDGYMSKFWGLFLMPLIMLGLFALFMLLPTVDPLRKNVKEFRTHYDGFLLAVLGFLFYINLLMILWNQGTKFKFVTALTPALGILFFYIGLLLERTKRNWFIGIRTPWTLSSDKVWEQTHRLGSQLFMLLGAIIVISAFFPAYTFTIMFSSVLIVVAITVIYSYVVYRQ